MSASEIEERILFHFKSYGQTYDENGNTIRGYWYNGMLKQMEREGYDYLSVVQAVRSLVDRGIIKEVEYGKMNDAMRKDADAPEQGGCNRLFVIVKQ